MMLHMFLIVLLGIVIGGCPVRSASNTSCVQHLRKLKLDRVCGYNLKSSVGLKRPNGEAWNSANFGEFPWTVAILGKNRDSEFHICDGSLIHPQVVLTVADCAKKVSPGRQFIRVGAKDPSNNPLNKPQDRTVEHVVYFNELKKDNVALLWFHNPLDISVDNVDLVCLSSLKDQDFHDRKCQISILDRNSKDESEESENSDELNNEIKHSANSESTKFDLSIKKVELEIVDSKKCDSKLANNTICAKSLARLHVCEAKQGSSIVCQHPNDLTRWVHVGSVAFNCDDPYETKADPYINIALSTKWIKKKIAELRKTGELIE